MRGIGAHLLFKKCRAGQSFTLIDGRSRTYQGEIPFPDAVSVLSKNDAQQKKLKDEEVIVLGDDHQDGETTAIELSNQGVENVYFLKGGMTEWGAYIESVLVGELSDGGEVYQLIRPSNGQLSYLVISEAQTLVINPAVILQPYFDFVEDKAFTFKHIVDTQVHPDHISGGRMLADEVEESYWLPESEFGVTLTYERLTEATALEVGNTNIPIRIVEEKNRVRLYVDHHFLFCHRDSNWDEDAEMKILPNRMMDYSEFNAEGFVDLKQRDHSLPTPSAEAFIRINSGALNVTDKEAFKIDLFERA